jgi:hypothetical protein
VCAEDQGEPINEAEPKSAEDDGGCSLGGAPRSRALDPLLCVAGAALVALGRRRRSA